MCQEIRADYHAGLLNYVAQLINQAHKTPVIDYRFFIEYNFIFGSFNKSMLKMRQAELCRKDKTNSALVQSLSLQSKLPNAATVTDRMNLSR